MMARQMNRGSRTAERIVTVFGGTGFLGRRIVTRFLDKDFTVRAASRHPDRLAALFSSDARSPGAVGADILDASSVASAIGDSYAVVNAVSLYVEHGNLTFERVHVKAAAELAVASRNARVQQFIQISGIGSDLRSDSSYIRARDGVADPLKASKTKAETTAPAAPAK
ncbi:NAD(P)H-binding protein [Phyllobacterium sp. LjRoot231]|uniref:NAD(P)H-binding protein n=1 Tax=Phyllobacterium sp. LjRoot231 TaxID=3342289 RepID=UPI003ECF0F94